MRHLVSDRVYEIWVLVMIVGTAIGWSIVEIVRLRRIVKLDFAVAVNRDRLVGCIVGLLIALAAGLGVVFEYT